MPSISARAIFVILALHVSGAALGGTITTGEDLFTGPLEVTQGIQNFGNDVRLVENKRTFVRFNPVYSQTAGTLASGGELRW